MYTCPLTEEPELGLALVSFTNTNYSIMLLHRVPKNGDTILIVIYLSNLNRFSKFFHWLILW